MNTKLLTTIPFQGFYNSIHDYAFDSEIEYEATDRDTDEIDAEKLNDLYVKFECRQAYKMYAKKYCDELSHQSGIPFEHESLSSPKEYNFTTDRIFAHIELSVIKTIFESIEKIEFDKFVKSRFTSCDGFISHYDNNYLNWGDISEFDHNQIGTILEFYINDQFNDIEFSVYETLACNGEIGEIVHYCLYHTVN